MDDLMKGQKIPEHYNVVIGTRAADALREMLSELTETDAFTLNEFEREVVDKLMESLDPE